jgi:hypothetical protein
MVRTSRLACVHVGDANVGRWIRMQSLRLLGEYWHRYSSSKFNVSTCLNFEKRGASRGRNTRVEPYGVPSRINSVWPGEKLLEPELGTSRFSRKTLSAKKKKQRARNKQVLF